MEEERWRGHRVGRGLCLKNDDSDVLCCVYVHVLFCLSAHVFEMCLITTIFIVLVDNPPAYFVLESITRYLCCRSAAGSAGSRKTQNIVVYCLMG